MRQYKWLLASCGLVSVCYVAAPWQSRVTAAQVDEALGLNARPSKPLLWKLGGHPRLPPTQHLYALSCRLQQLCAAATVRYDTQSLAALNPIKKLLLSESASESAEQHEAHVAGAMDAGADTGLEQQISDELAASVAANLAADVELRRSLQEGVALFHLAVGRAAGQAGTALLAGKLASNIADPAAAAALLVNTLQRELEAKAAQVSWPILIWS